MYIPQEISITKEMKEVCKNKDILLFAIPAAIKLGQRYGVELLIIKAVHQVVEGANPLETVKSLMREKKRLNSQNLC